MWRVRLRLRDKTESSGGECLKLLCKRGATVWIKRTSCMLNHLSGSGFSRFTSLPFGLWGSLSITKDISHWRL